LTGCDHFSAGIEPVQAMSSIPAYRFCCSPLFEGNKKKKVFAYNGTITVFSDGVTKTELMNS